MKPLITAAAALGILGSSALADTPTLGGPMSHLLVTLFQNQIFVTFESPSMSTVTMQDNPGTFTGAPSVLNDLGYNGQFGWMANGFISLPPMSGIFVRTISMSEHLSVFEQASFDEILGTGSSTDTWQWNGTMTHNWYATEVKGPHHASYEVFVGDLAGNPLDGYQSGFIELNFQYGPDLSGRVGSLDQSIRAVPAPGSLLLLAMGSFVGTKRRR